MKKLLFALAAISALGVATVMAAPIEHHAVLTGKVSTVVAIGTPVTKGQTLITVETLAGPMAASKAVVNGIVTAVNVTTGTDVTRGQVVATVDSK